MAPDPPVIGYLARLCPAKGLETLVEAYILLRKHHPFPRLRLHLAGSMTAADAPFVDEIRARLAAAGLEEEVQVRPNLSRAEKITFLQGLSAFSVPESSL